MDGFEWLLDEAERLNRNQKAPRARRSMAPLGSVPGDRPGDDFIRRATWHDILPRHGWREAGFSGQKTYWRRPGKDDPGWSATTGYCSTAVRGDLLYVFSSNAEPFEAEEGYSKFEALALLDHDGDFQAAARALLDQGYGKPSDPLRVLLGPAPPGHPSLSVSVSSPIGPGTETESGGWPLPIPASQLRRREDGKKWLWHGYLSRGGFTLFSALWKAGKTTLLAHLLHALESEGRFCGLEVKGCRVLVVSEEDEDTWAERRDDLALHDHLEFLPRPFRARPTLPEWRSFLAHLAGLCESRCFDLVIFDTISKLWPVRDENDAPGVENALMPLYCLSDKDCAVLLVHHLRKSDGTQATGSRGSGTLPAFAETIMELRRYEAGNRKDTRRVISAYGRFRETPDELVVDLTARGYIPLGEKDEVASREARQTLLDILPTKEPGATTEQLMEWLGWAKKTILPIIEAGAEAGTIRRSGTGKRGSPFLYWRSPQPILATDPAVSGSSPIGEETETAAGAGAERGSHWLEEALLLSLDRDGEQPATRLAERLGLLPATVAAELERLAEDGQVYRRGLREAPTYLPLRLSPSTDDSVSGSSPIGEEPETECPDPPEEAS